MGARRLAVAPGAERRENRLDVHVFGAAAPDELDALAHLDGHDRHIQVQQIDQLVGDGRDAGHFLRPGRPGHERVQPAQLLGHRGFRERLHDGLLVERERVLVVLADDLDARALLQQVRHRARIGRPGGRVGHPAGIGVDAQGDGGRFERLERHAPPLELLDQHGARRAHDLAPARRRRQVALIGGVVVVDDPLDRLRPEHVPGLAQPARRLGVHHDRPLHAGQVQLVEVLEPERVFVHGDVVPHPVHELLVHHRHRARVQLGRGHGRADGVEVAVGVGQDDVHGEPACF
ncbi:hypothetical protein D3C72_1415630 [compost metagenome]